MRKTILALICLANWLAVADPISNAPPVAAPAPPVTATAPPVIATVPPVSATTPPVTATLPKVLTLELSILRFKPATNGEVFQDFKLSGSTAAIVSTLRAAGRSVEVLYHGDRQLVLEPRSSAKFNGTETRPVIVLGKQTAPPPAVVYGLTMEVISRPLTDDAYVLSWDGFLNWSPDLIDRRPTGPNAVQIFGRAASAAQSVTAATGNTAAADIGLAVAELFKEDPANNGAIYELPVLKTIAFSGSRVCHGTETIINSTAAEAGAKEPQIIFFVLNQSLQ